LSIQLGKVADFAALCISSFTPTLLIFEIVILPKLPGKRKIPSDDPGIIWHDTAMIGQEW